MRRVVVTGLGTITPLGHTVQQTWSRLINAKSGITSTRDLGPEFQSIPSQVAGLIQNFNPSTHLSPTETKQTAQFARFGLVAAHEALLDSGLLCSDERTVNSRLVGTDMIGVCLGSGIGNLHDLYETSVVYGQTKNYRKIHPLFVPRLLINLGAGHVSMRYGLRGPNHAATTACTTGAHSIGDALRFIQHGDADVMLAGGAESCIHPLALGGFSRSRSLSTAFNATPEKASRPFDADRDGFVIAEGAAVLVLEEEARARARGANVYAEIVGYGCSADAHHLTAPKENGEGALLAMRKALRQAGVKPNEVDYINAHATSTPLGDAAENRAIKSLMLGSEGRNNPEEINVSSTKGAVGHLLGAAGAVEVLFSVLAVREGIMPPTLNLERREAEFDCNYAAGQAQKRTINVALTNSFGFGGTNASLCFKAYK